MKMKTKFPKSCLLAVFLAALATAIVAAIIVFLFLRNVQRTRIAANLPPTVIVHAPVNGESIQAGDTILAYVTAAAQDPMMRLEFWLDGALVDTQTPDATQGEVTTFSAFTEMQIDGGLHIFSARAVDASGRIGQSLPIALQGNAVLEMTAISAEEGQTLDDIAAAIGSDGALLQEINPGLGDGALPGGTQVIVPVPGGSNPPNGGQPGNTGPTINPPAPLPVSPTGVAMLPIPGPIIDIGSLLPMLLSGRPKAPTPLQAGFENCTVRLLWMDNAENETHFKVWMQALGGPPKVIATLKNSPKTGPAWYEFTSPSAGIYSFWVEATNALGGQSSEIVWVGVPDLGCSPGVATHLDIEILYMSVFTGYDRVYCYLSVEGAPEKRIPSNDSQFIQVKNGVGDISDWTGSGNSFLLPEPQDSEVTLESTCLGWKGGSGPDNLGNFSTSNPQNTWDGRQMQLSSANYAIGYRIQPHGPVNASGSFAYIDYTLPIPFQPWVTTMASPNAVENDFLARRPTLHWKWNGDKSILTGFSVFLDGKEFDSRPVSPGGTNGVWEDTFVLPTSCGGVYTFEVAANSGEALSAPSMAYRYTQPACGTYAEVKFEEIYFGCLDDGDAPVIPFVPMDCESGSFGKSDTIEAYYWLAVHGEMISFSERNMTTDVHYSFQNLGFNSPQKHQYPSYDTFLVPIDAQNPAIWFGLNMKDADPWWDADDHICGIGKDLSMPYADWINYDQEYELVCESRDAYGWVKIRVRGIQSLDSWRSANPGIGPPIGP